MMFVRRLHGIVFVCVGLLLYFYLIPAQTEAIAYGWTKPQTIPNLVAVVITLCGALLVMKPPPQTDVDVAGFARAAFFLAVLAAGVALIAYVGFVPIAPCLALAIMLLVGERRPGWLAGGVIGIPLIIWLVAEVLLGRSLP